jgi:hypothetical protein
MITPLPWQDQERKATAQLTNLAYYIEGHTAFLVVRGWGGQTRRLHLGHFNTVGDAKRKCEQHFADGCDVSAAKPIRT